MYDQTTMSGALNAQHSLKRFRRARSQRAFTRPRTRTKYTYDATTGLLSTIAYPLNGQMTYRITPGYTYQHGFLQQIFDSRTPTTIWWQANAMNPRGQITQETTEDLSGHPQIVSNRTYDAVTGWLASTQTGPGGGATLQNEAYLYDEMGNVTQRQNNNLGLTENFYYDNLYRLDHSMLGSSVNLQMGYDAMGDITSRSDVAGGATWTYDPVRKHAVTQAGSSAFTYAYDANGNVKSRNGSFIGWTSYNYPNNVSAATESATFNYGPNRQRWSMVYNGPAGQEITYYVTPLFEIMYAGGLSTNRHYIYAGGRPVVEVSTYNGVVTVQSLLVDHQGSISSVVTDSTGASLVSESFTAYGNRREASTWTGTPTSGELTTMNGVTREGYTFQTVLGSMGLNHMNGRVEDSVTGRFLSPDPRGTIRGETQSWNRYSYVNNNPVTMTDPSGFYHVPCIDYCTNGGKSKPPIMFGGGNTGDDGLAGLQANDGTLASLSLVEYYDDSADSIGTPNSAGDGNSDLGNALRQVPLIGGILGAAGDILSGAANIALGIGTFNANTLDSGFFELAGGIGSALQIGFTDVIAASFGVGGYVYENAKSAIDVLSLGNAFSSGNFLGSLGHLAQTAAIPDYGLFGGPSWGIDQSRQPSEALTYVDYISYQHDVAYGGTPPAANASANWVGAGWSSVPTGMVAPGPAGIAYVLLGTIPFLLENAVKGY